MLNPVQLTARLLNIYIFAVSSINSAIHKAEKITNCRKRQITPKLILYKNIFLYLIQEIILSDPGKDKNKKTILCYGSSSTWGYDPMSGARYDENIRWPCVMENSLGSGFQIIEEGTERENSS